MDFGGLSMLEEATKNETGGKEKNAENTLTEAPVLVNKSDAEPDMGPQKSEGKEDSTPVENEPNPAEEALREASLAAQQAAKKAAAAVSQLGGKLSTWWTNLDPPNVPPPKEGSQQSAVEGPPQAVQEVDLQSTFGLGPEENLIEAFLCTLVQTYRCSHNSHTPELPRTYRGTLYITEKHTCFYSTANEEKVAFALEHAKVTSVLRQSSARSSQPATLKLVHSSDNWIALKDFATAADLESAFALLEHKTDETN